MMDSQRIKRAKEIGLFILFITFLLQRFLHWGSIKCALDIHCSSVRFLVD